MSTELNITMIGTGYVGLVSGTCFAEMGFNVTCVDIDAEKVRKLKEDGIIPIYEPGLTQLVQKNAHAGRLHFTTNLAKTVPTADAVFIAVGTPQDEDGSADMKYVLAAARDIAQHLSGYTVIVNKSTVPVGTAERVRKAIAEANPEAAFDVVSNPEFLREGCAVGDFLNPDRVVVGVDSDKARHTMVDLYQPLTENGAPLVITDTASSELIKYAANAFLAMKITFINEIAHLCEKVGADVQQVSKGLGLDTRVGSRFLQPGPGYGGSCFPKDTHALAKIGADNGVPQTLVETTIRTNEAIKLRMADKIIAANGGDVAGKNIAILGVAFKAGTDDMRDAPALTIIPELQKRGAHVVAYDPEAMERALELLPDLNAAPTLESCTKDADCVVILTEWPEFSDKSLAEVMQYAPKGVCVDCRNLFTPAAAGQAGIRYVSIGRQNHSAN